LSNFLNTLISSTPSKSSTKTGKEYGKNRLWHDLTGPVLEYVGILSKSQPNQVLIDFYNLFIADLEAKINYLKYAIMVVITSRKFEKREEANEFLKKISERLTVDREAQLLLEIEMAANLLFMDKLAECGDELVRLKSEIEKLQSPDIILYSEFYKAYARYFDRRKDYAEFYQYALQYLAYTPEATIEARDKIEWSIKMGMAVLLGKTIYNIGELVEEDILKSLTTTDYVWLYNLLQAMDNAKVSEFFKAVQQYRLQVEAIPEIKESLEDIYVKIRILALLDLVFRRQKEDRTITFSTVAQVTEVKEEEVEWLLIKAMSLDLIRGEIDQVDGTVKITWVKPRVLDPQRIQIVRGTIDKWKNKVGGILKELEENTKELGKP
jgi:26S proteasome regulatory subunit N9